MKKQTTQTLNTCVGLLILDKVDLKAGNTTRNKEKTII